MLPVFFYGPVIMNDQIDSIEPVDAIVETAEEISERRSIYGEIKRALTARGIPAEEIAFIHDFATPAAKVQAFAAVNAGRIRVLIASTEKAGCGCNFQERLIAEHHLTIPWKPAELEQREGRILRQGNIYPEVYICNYVTEGSFDAYLWQTLESKARFISQIMAGEVTARTAEDVDQLVMTAAQIKAIASGNPQILEKVALEVELTKLERLYSVWVANRRRMREQLESLPSSLEQIERTIGGHRKAVAARDRYTGQHDGSEFLMLLRRGLSSEEVIQFNDRQRAAAHLRQLDFAVAREAQRAGRVSQVVGSYRGFEIVVQASGKSIDLLSSLFSQTQMALRVGAGEQLFNFNVGESDIGIIQSMDAQLRGLDHKLQQSLAAQQELQHRQTQITTGLSGGWGHSEKYQEMKARLAALNHRLSQAGCEFEPSPALSNLDADALVPATGEVVVRQLASFAIPENETISRELSDVASVVEQEDLISDYPPDDLQPIDAEWTEPPALESEQEADSCSEVPIPIAEESLALENEDFFSGAQENQLQKHKLAKHSVNSPSIRKKAAAAQMCFEWS